MTILAKEPIAMCVKHLWYLEVFSWGTSLLIRLSVLKHKAHKTQMCPPGQTDTSPRSTVEIGKGGDSKGRIKV